ncbi:MAG: M15 family metallopeptidase [Lachnospiraceae bacterium]|nr:M15 family metallopeptidase [Lachnospiraceae bacterium]
MSKKKKIVLAVVLAVLVCLIAAVVFVIIKYPNKLRRMASTVINSFNSGNKLKLKSVEQDGLESVDVEKFMEDERVSADQSLMLINTQYMLSEDFTADVAEYGESGVYMNLCIQDAYRELAAAVSTEFDTKLYVRSAYRSAQEQQEQVEENSEVATAVGASEHQAGLALDVYVPYFAGMGFLDSDAGVWVNKNCQDYGFIIRYPAYGEKSTGVTFEPWHIRYVGLPHAKIIAEQKITLEKYVEGLAIGKIYTYGDYYIERCVDKVLLPGEFESAVISPDNTGGYIVTFK